MEDIDEGQNNVGLQSDDTIQSIDTKLGPEENRIKEIILENFTQKNVEEINKSGDNREFEKKASLAIKSKLDEEFGGNWNIVFGEVFVTCLGLLPQDRFGHFKVMNFNILVFETSGDRA
jgi:hypothetical protein